jgi:hypothetical protein
MKAYNNQTVCELHFEKLQTFKDSRNFYIGYAYSRY